MPANTEALYSTIGRRIAELRKQRKLSQVDLASSLTHKRTQAWVSTVESGNRKPSAFDLFEIAAILETTVGELFSTLPLQPGSMPKALSNIVNELRAHLPTEMPIYLQRDIGEPDAVPIEYQYGPIFSAGSIFDSSHPFAPNEVLSGMVVERYYSAPRMEPTDLLTFSGALVPYPDTDERIADRILVKLNEPFDGLSVHPCLVRSLGEAETTLAGRKTVVFTEDEFEVLGVLTLRRTLYKPSPRRAWLQRKFGIIKDERVIDQGALDKY